MGDINVKGIVAGAITWLVILFFLCNDASIGRGNDDQMLFGIICVGMLVPAWVVALVVSSMFPDKK